VPASQGARRLRVGVPHRLHARRFNLPYGNCLRAYPLRQYRAAGRAEGEALAAQRLLPLVPGLLLQPDPMPLFTLKLTCAVLDAAPACAVPVLQRRAPCHRAPPGRGLRGWAPALPCLCRPRRGLAPPCTCTAGGLLCYCKTLTLP